jgi:hypothetical protein
MKIAQFLLDNIEYIIGIRFKNTLNSKTKLFFWSIIFWTQNR